MKIKLLFCLVLLISGCGDDTVTPAPAEYSYPETKADLMEVVKTSYDDMDIDSYTDCLHESFKFIFTAEEAAVFEILNGYFERAEDLEVMENTFSGDSHINPFGYPMQGFQSISISNWSLAGVWQLMPADHADFPESYRGLYDIYMVYYEVGGEYTLTVETSQLFYVESVEELQDDGSTRTRWYLVGQEDFPLLSKNETVSWGAMKAVYR